MANDRFGGWEAERTTSGRPFHATCYAPFVSLEFDTQGFAYTCCANGTYPVGNVATDTLDEIWTGARLAAQRDALRTGDLSYGCAVCRWYFDNDRPTPPAVMYEGFPVGTGADDLPRSMAFAFSNQCNLQCIQCSGEYSSSIRIHREGRAPLPHAYGPAFFDQLRAFLPGLEEIRLLGGEPFLVSETFQLFDLLAELDLRPRVHVTTNGTRFDRRVEAAFDRFPLSISLSLDAVSAPVLESIRVGASAPEILANARRLAVASASSGGRFGINFCLLRQNWQELPAILRLGEELGAWVSVIPVYGDDHSLYKLDRTALAAVAEELGRHDDALRSELQLNRPVWDAELGQIRAAAAAPGNAPAPMLEPTRHDNAATFVRERRSAAVPAVSVAPPPPRWWRRRHDVVARQAPAPDLSGELVRWAVGGAVVRVDTDARDQIEAAIVVEGTPPRIDPSTWMGRSFGDVAEELRTAWGSSVWLVEDDRTRPDIVDQLVAFSPTPHREKRGVVVRVVSQAFDGGGWRTLLAIDPSFLHTDDAPEAAQPVGSSPS
jgi:MoaA/NifB/PqqE/SkfB family radical SAM enzyme